MSHLLTTDYLLTDFSQLFGTHIAPRRQTRHHFSTSLWIRRALAARDDPRPSDAPHGGVFHRDQDLANEALKLLRLRGLDQCGSISSDMEERQLSERQASYGLQMAPAFAWTRRVFTSGNHVPQYLDYLPWIRYIVGVENAAQTQQTLAPNMSQSKRTSENSRKTRENRFINLSKDDLETLRETALGFPEEI